MSFFLARFWSYIRLGGSPAPSPPPPPSQDDNNKEALRKAWVRDQMLDARIRLLEKEVLGEGKNDGGR